MQILHDQKFPHHFSNLDWTTWFSSQRTQKMSCQHSHFSKNFEKCKGLLTSLQVVSANFEINLVLVEDNEGSQMSWQTLKSESERNLYQNWTKPLVVKREKWVVRATEDCVSRVWFVIHIPEVVNFVSDKIFTIVYYCWWFRLSSQQ